jgi:hypothetical protein
VYAVDANDAPRLLRNRDTDGLSGWSDDGQSLFIYRAEERRIKILRFNLLTETEELVRETAPTDSAGEETMLVFVTPDSKSYVYELRHTLADLYLVNGLK